MMAALFVTIRLLPRVEGHNQSNCRKKKRNYNPVYSYIPQKRWYSLRKLL